MNHDWANDADILTTFRLEVRGMRVNEKQTVWVWVTTALMKHHDQSTLGFIWFILPYCCLSSEEAKTGTQTRQEPRSRSWCRGHGGVLLTSLFPEACSTCFHIEPRTTNPQWSSVLHHQSLIKKILYRVVYPPPPQSYGCIFINWAFFFSDDFSPCQVNIKLTSTQSLKNQAIGKFPHFYHPNLSGCGIVYRDSKPNAKIRVRVEKNQMSNMWNLRSRIKACYREVEIWLKWTQSSRKTTIFSAAQVPML